MNELIDAVSVVGFPVMICVYALWIINKTMATLGNVVNENTIATKELIVLIRERLR